ncbi:thioesterase-like superfamily protein [Mycobacterium kansasii 732]|nr:thioesterase-like superfamily protein [Mycobacterium kansasii 732]
MTTDSEQAQWSVDRLLELFEVRAEDTDRFSADTGIAGDDDRQVVEGTQVLAQAIVAVAKRFPGKSVRSAHAVFSRAVAVGPPVELLLDVVHEGRSTATAVVSAQQDGRRCITMTVLADVPTGDVIRHHLPRPGVAAPGDANVSRMPMIGRELRLVDVVDVNSPDEVGPPELFAWLRYDPIPARDDLAKALVAYFTGHLGISTTMRAHRASAPARRI